MWRNAVEVSDVEDERGSERSPERRGQLADARDVDLGVPVPAVGPALILPTADVVLGVPRMGADREQRALEKACVGDGRVRDSCVQSPSLVTALSSNGFAVRM